MARVSHESCERYLAALRTRRFESEVANVCCILEAPPHWMRIYFLEQTLPLSPELFELAEGVLGSLGQLDHQANTHSNLEKYDPYLMDIYVSQDGEIELRYCSNVVNTEWGAYFRKTQGGQFEFVELG